jgi:hypothetical protein
VVIATKVLGGSQPEEVEPFARTIADKMRNNPFSTIQFGRGPVAGKT